MKNLPPIRSGRCWRLAGIAFFLVALLPASPAQARTQLDFSLDREFRGRVVPSFSRVAPPAAAIAREIPLPPRPNHGAAEASRQGFTLVKLRFAL